ncbi:MAG TPA: transposase [Polyangia bacterium]|nr:transposase [Polyangia bacterium]
MVKNVTDAFDELLKQRRWETTTDGAVAPAEPPPEADGAEEEPAEEAGPADVAPPAPPAARAEPLPPARPLSPTKQQELARRAAREARWKAVHDRRAQGDSIRRIAETLHLHRRTVRRLLDSAVPPRNGRDQPRPGGISSPKLAPYTDYLQQRWSDGCTNAVRLYGEIVERGYDGSRTLLSEAVRSWRPPQAPKPLRQKRNRRAIDHRRLRRLLTHPPERLTDQERPVVQRLLDADETVSAAYTLVQRFRTVLKDKDAAGLETWLADAQASGIPSLAGVANGMLADHAAVAAAITEPWSNGTVEGHVHKVKGVSSDGLRGFRIA